MTNSLNRSNRDVSYTSNDQQQNDYIKLVFSLFMCMRLSAGMCFVESDFVFAMTLFRKHHFQIRMQQKPNECKYSPG